MNEDLSSEQQIEKKIVVCKDKIIFCEASTVRYSETGDEHIARECIRHLMNFNRQLANLKLQLKRKNKVAKPPCDMCGLVETLIEYGNHDYCGACLDEAKE